MLTKMMMMRLSCADEERRHLQYLLMMLSCYSNRPCMMVIRIKDLLLMRMIRMMMLSCVEAD